MKPTDRRVLRATWEGSDHDLSARCSAVVRELRLDATVLPVSSVSFAALADGVLLEVVIEVPDRAVPDRIEWLTVGRALLYHGRRVFDPHAPLAPRSES